MQVNSKYSIDWSTLILTICFISATIPKIIITDGINIFLPELFLFGSVFIFGIRQFLIYNIGRYLVALFSVILFFSITAQLNVSDIGAVLRAIKELLYIPLIYWAAQNKNPFKLLKRMSYFGILAMISNLILYRSNQSGGVVDIWAGAESLSSGLSNRGIKLGHFKLEQLKGLAHGIWGSYCILVTLITFFLYEKKIINVIAWVVCIILFVVNVSISVSRETILIVMVIALCYMFFKQKKIRYKLYVLIGLSLLVAYLLIWGQDLPIVQKLLYTQESVQNSGTEGNAQIRVNTWIAYFEFIGHNIIYLFCGLGLSPKNFGQHVMPYRNFKEIVDVPESAFVYAIAYGGLLSLIFFLGLIFECGKLIYNRIDYKLLKYYFIGLLITNIFSGVSMFSDLLYAHLCIILGFFLYNKNLINENFTYNSKS